MKKRLIAIAVMLMIELALILMMCGLNGVLTTKTEPKETVRFVCDGFFISGVLYLCFGCLIWLSKEGAFDGLGFTVSNWKQSLFNNKRDWHKEEEFYEYKERQLEKKKNRQFIDFLIVGGASVLVAVVLYIVYACAL